MTEPVDDLESPNSLAPKKRGPKDKLKPDAETLKQLGGLGRIHATTKDCAAWFDVSEPTFLKLLKNKDAKEAYENGKGKGRISLRRMQFRLAETNAVIQIWLGKQLLDQKDRQEFSSGDGPGGVQTVVIYGGAPPKPAGYED